MKARPYAYGVLVGTVKHLGPDERDQLTIEAMSTEAVTTSEIEGETLDRASVQSSIRKQLGLSTDNRRVGPAEQGIAEMMVDLYRSFAAPLSHETLFAWHRMLVSGRRDLEDVGRYRTGKEPMQVVSRTIYEPKVHFEAPALLAGGARDGAICSTGVPEQLPVAKRPYLRWRGQEQRTFTSRASTRSRMETGELAGR